MMTNEERLERLEKELAGAKRHRRVLLVTAAMTLIAVFALCAGTGTIQKTVRAERFELVGSVGKVRAALSLADSGRPSLRLYDGSDRIRAELALDRFERPTLALYDQNGNSRANLEWLGEEPVLGLKRLDSICPGALTDYGALLTPYALDLRYGDVANQCEANVSVHLFAAKLGAGLQIDRWGQARAALGAMHVTTSDGRSITYPESSVLLFGPDGKAVWRAP